jgi:succinate-semialdehyde dehydrogenase/glutarate-semialdehyde dehydrogenase
LSDGRRETRVTLISINPATGETLETFGEATPEELERALARAHAAFLDWRRRPASERAGLLRRAATVLRDRRSEYGRVMAREMGKPLAQGQSEAEKCAWTCEYYAEHAEEFLAEQPRQTDSRHSVVRFDPLGPVLAIMPWNFPFFQVFRFAAPALAAGNVAILKHASNVPRCALEVEGVFREAGFPPGVFQTVLTGSARVPDLIADRRVAAVTLTGSASAGRAVAGHAGRNLKKTVLELGGSDPFVVLGDADLARAASAAARARLINSGQSCIAAKRFIAVESVADAFLEAFAGAMGRASVGDPLADGTEVGPQARVDLRDELHRQVRRSLEQGARLVIGGEPPEGPGAFYPPTVLAAVRPGMAAFDEETFGPAAAVVRARDEADAVRLANASEYGLGASLWTEDIDRGCRLAAEIEAGVVFVNGVVRSDPRMPFGGVKHSGYGRELSEFGLREFVNVKTVRVD